MGSRTPAVAATWAAQAPAQLTATAPAGPPRTPGRSLRSAPVNLQPHHPIDMKAQAQQAGLGPVPHEQGISVDVAASGPEVSPAYLPGSYSGSRARIRSGDHHSTVHPSSQCTVRLRMAASRPRSSTRNRFPPGGAKPPAGALLGGHLLLESLQHLRGMLGDLDVLLRAEWNAHVPHEKGPGGPGVRGIPLHDEGRSPWHARPRWYATEHPMIPPPTMTTSQRLSSIP